MLEESLPTADARESHDPAFAIEFTGIDTHAHVFRQDMPMIAGRRYTPTYDAPLSNYLEMLDAHGLSHAVLTPVSIFGTDNTYLLWALQQEPLRLRGLVAVLPTIGQAELDAYDRMGVVGVRQNLIGLPDPDFSDPVWQRYLERLATLGWQIELQVEAARLSRVIPPLLACGVNVVIDHFGRPDAGYGVTDPGFRYLLTCGRTRRIWVKLSGAYRNSGEAGEHIAPEATGMLLGEFGSDRLMWGSDWPHTCFESPDAMRRARAALDDWVGSESDRIAVMIDTPRRLFFDKF